MMKMVKRFTRPWRKLLCAITISLQLSVGVASAAQRKDEVFECGTDYAPPHANPAPRRDCPNPTARHYTPRHHGIGFDALNLESEACFVPDSAYALLDEIIDRTLARLTPAQRTGKGIATKVRTIAISKAMHSTLIELGFGLYIPTETLSDALVSRAAPGEPSAYIEDCDIASLILMTIADTLHMRASLVEIALNSHSLHNYVQWHLGNGQVVNWDTNAQKLCRTLREQTAYRGEPMTRRQTIGYLYRLRIPLWKTRHDFDRAIDDYQAAMADWSTSPVSFNGFAWTVATVDWPARKSLLPRAQSAIETAIRLQIASGSPAITRAGLGDYYDTRACLYAYVGDFSKATTAERQAIALFEYPIPEFESHLAKFSGSNPQDCTGEE